MNRVIHFEIHAQDPTRAAKFYSDLFGWEIKEWVMDPPAAEENRYWMVITGPKEQPGISGGLLFRRGPAPKAGDCVTAFVCTIDVTSVDEYTKKIEAAGGKNVVPKMPVSDIAWLAYFNDTEGNIFGIYEERKKS